MYKTKHSSRPPRIAPPLRVGFVPLTDCAPLVMAKELGLFDKYGLRVELKRELGWATIRDKVAYRELDAAHTVVGMPFAATLGLGSIACECVTGLILNQHGNAITLSDRLWKKGVNNATSLRREVSRLGAKDLLTFGVVYPFSSHNFLLRSWFSTAGILPDRDVRIVVVPPAQMVPNLNAGHLDGFCVGEPWNSAAAQLGASWCAATSAELAPGHPEKVLMVRRDFAEKQADEHLALIAAIMEACIFCQQVANHNHLAEVLARPEYVGVSAKVLACGIRGELQFGPGKPCYVPSFNVFYSPDANEPSAEKAAWVLRQLRQGGLVPNPARLDVTLARQVFRPDLYQKACALTQLYPTTSLKTNETISETNLVRA
jgi:two-component system, oxyanion-binding sensor